MAIVRNLATVKTTADITSSVTSIPVNRVDVFGTSQTTLDNPFYVTIMPASGDEPANSTNSEIVLVTGISGSNLTVTRGQRSTTAKAFNSGAIVTMAIYAEDAVLLGDEGTAVENPAPWIETSDIKNVAVTTDKIADGAVKSEKIDWTTLKTGKPTEVGSGIANRTITANSVGFMIINTACAFEQYCEVYLNGTSLGSSKSGGTTTFTWFQTTVFVAKGDVVRITTSDNGGNAQIAGVKFVPIS